MFNIIDVIGIIIILVGAIIAFVKGFVKTFFGFISTFLAILLAFMFCNVGVSIIKNSTGIDEWLKQTIEASLAPKTQEDATNEIEEEEDNGVLELLKNLPQNIKDTIDLEEYKEQSKQTIIEGSTEMILKILSWITIYLMVRLILLIICVVFQGIMSIPFLKQINNLAGLILGILLGLFRIYVILAFISFLAPVVPGMEPFIDLIRNSLWIKIMYENNIVISLIF